MSDVIQIEALAQMIDKMAQMIDKMDRRFSYLIQYVDDTNRDTTYSTALAFCAKKPAPVGFGFIRKLEKLCTKMCKKKDIPIELVYYVSHGYPINNFPIHVLEKCLKKLAKSERGKEQWVLGMPDLEIGEDEGND